MNLFEIKHGQVVRWNNRSIRLVSRIAGGVKVSCITSRETFDITEDTEVTMLSENGLDIYADGAFRHANTD